MNLNIRNRLWPTLLWTVYFLCYWLAWGSIRDKDYTGEFYSSLVDVAVNILATYFIIYILIEKIYLVNKLRLFYTALAGSIIGFSILNRVLTYELVYTRFTPDYVSQVPIFYLPKIIIGALETSLLAGVGCMFYFISIFRKQEKVSQQLVIDKREAEMELLKSQIQPHFIFNTLNNIYALSQENSPLTSEMIFRLASLLDYMLYDAGKILIPLEKEMTYISNYIALQRIRYADNLDVVINLFDDLEGIAIPPLLILPFVENSFKHGVSSQTYKGWLTIDISVKDKELTVKVENSKAADYSSQAEKTGIGISNIRKRLDILYQDRYTLKCLNESESYLVILKLKNR
jgi:two-component system LytT family sensor kinase